MSAHHPELNNRLHRAEFKSTGVTFEPRNGGPRWSYNFSESKGVSPEAKTHMIVYDHGSISERYVLKRNTIEQQFLIPAPPKSGELVLAGMISSDGDFESHARGWTWRNDMGVVSLGKVTVIDAEGKRINAAMDVTKDKSVIRVSEKDLGTAKFPLLVDPEIGTDDLRISSMGTDGTTAAEGVGPEVAYDSTSDKYLVVFSGDNIGGAIVNDESEIWGQFVNASTGALVGSNFRISTTGTDGDATRDATNPTVANNPGDSEFLVTWQSDNDNAGLANDELEVFGQLVNDDGTLILSNFRISTMGTDGDASRDAQFPHVAYSSMANNYMVVWLGDAATNGDDEIYGQLVDFAGNLSGSRFQVSDMGPSGSTTYNAMFLPEIVFNSTSGEFLVIWFGTDNAGSLSSSENEIYGQILSASGTENGTDDFRISDMGNDGDFNHNAVNPAAAYNSTNNQYLVVWEGDDDISPLVNNEFEIFGQLLDNTGAETGTNDFRISFMGPDGNTSYLGVQPDVQYLTNMNEYIVVYYGDDNTSPLVDGELEIFGQRVRANGTFVGSRIRLSAVGTNGSTTSVAFDPQVTVRGSDNSYLAVWFGDDTTGTLVDNEIEVFGQIYANETYTPTPTFTPSSTATNTPTSTRTNTPTNTNTSTATNAATNTPTNTATFTPTNTATFTSTATNTSTNTATATPTNTKTNTPTATNTPTPTPTVPSGELAGTILDSNGKPAAGVVVYLYRQGNSGASNLEPVEKADFETGTLSTLTDSEGKYSFKGLSVGAYKVSPNLTGFSFLPETVTVSSGNAAQTIQSVPQNLNDANCSRKSFIADILEADESNKSILSYTLSEANRYDKIARGVLSAPERKKFTANMSNAYGHAETSFTLLLRRSQLLPKISLNCGARTDCSLVSYKKTVRQYTKSSRNLKRLSLYVQSKSREILGSKAGEVKSFSKIEKLYREVKRGLRKLPKKTASCILG